MLKRIMKWIVIVLLVAFLLMQVIPYGRASHTNPDKRIEPEWDTPRTRELAVRACYDCHSNETKWPWYSHVAPFSWLIQDDVDKGRRKLNFSEFDRKQPKADEAYLEVQNGAMPLWYYLPFHAAARLTEDETKELITGLENTFD